MPVRHPSSKKPAGTASASEICSLGAWSFGGGAYFGTKHEEFMDNNDVTILRNKPDQKWEMMLPELGKDSPLYTILRGDPVTDATTLMIDFPTAIHIPKHTHEKSETHIILRGSHLFENNDTGERFDVP